ncbi:MAG: homoserine dehydrogenase [Chloroflexi bacterium]|nr:homoserine dehydrogenase [Chloroflexota bacterium]
MKLILIGFGVVGQGFAQILRDKAAELLREENFSAQIIGVATASKGALYHAAGLELQSLLEAAQAGSFASYPEQDGLIRGLEVDEMIAAGDADALVEMSPTNLETAQPALDFCRRALDAGLHLVLANKGPVALDYAGLKSKARAKGLQMRYEATVMAGTPTIQLAVDALAGCQILSARGILNGTTNYILTRMEAGLSYDEALSEAQALGYAESDPSGDVEGWDAAGKVLILANALFGRSLALDDLDVSGITEITAADIAEARAAGQRYKLIASARPDGGAVKATRLPLDEPLAGVGGSTNAISLKTDLMGDITLIGAGAGPLETGCAILSDLLAIQRMPSAT